MIALTKEPRVVKHGSVHRECQVRQTAAKLKVPRARADHVGNGRRRHIMSPFDGMEDIVREFLVESHENLDRLDQEFIVLEEDPANREVLASIFRTIHTIKGTSGFFGLSKLEKLTHAGESLLSQLRDGRKVLSPGITTVLLSMVDAVREMLRAIENQQNEGGGDYEPLVAELGRLLETGATPAPPPAPAATVSPGAAPTPAPAPASAHAPQPAPATVPPMGQLLVETGKARAESVDEALRQQEGGDPRHIGEILVEQGAIQPAEVRSALDRQQDERGRGSVADSTLRVEVANLDRLMNLAGELVLARNQLLQYAAGVNETSFTPILQRLNLITTELQEGVMKTRMQPIGTLWSKFPRIVRDLARSCGKQVRLEMEGRETELDKSILEAVKDPLTHIVRNSVDHGVERPEVRRAAGKPEEGVVHLRAFHEGGQVHLEIRDDGAGLDTEAIRRKALEKGLADAATAAALSERDLVNLIFQPGFSTASQVSSVSGRGVGMDVVRTNITRIGGSVDMQSRRGTGSVLKITIPLTLAIIPALVVRVGEERYALPQVSLLELVRLDGEQARRGIEMIHDAPVYRLRGRLLPLVHLREQLGYPPAPERPRVNIVVLQADGQPFGLVVDEITDTEEIVVKPLWAVLKRLNVYAGATIMGDGSVALILDVLGLAQQSRVVGRSRQVRLLEAAPVAEEGAGEVESLLLFRVGDGHMAIPLEQVDRLEELEAARVERAGSQEVVQYRGRILPLLRPSRHLQERRGKSRAPAAAGDGLLQVVVCHVEGGSCGLVVDGIDDIAREAVTARRPSSRAGVTSVIVVRGRVTELLDLERLSRLAG